MAKKYCTCKKPKEKSESGHCTKCGGQIEVVPVNGRNGKNGQQLPDAAANYQQTPKEIKKIGSGAPGPGRRKGTKNKLTTEIKKILQDKGPGFLEILFKQALREIQPGLYRSTKKSYTKEDIMDALVHNPRYPLTRMVVQIILKAMPTNINIDEQKAWLVAFFSNATATPADKMRQYIQSGEVPEEFNE